MTTTLTELPSVITAKTKQVWQSTFPDYPANDGWTAKVYLSGATDRLNGGAGVAGVANGSSFDFTLTTAQMNLVAGEYRWQIIVTKSGEDELAASGKVKIEASLVAAAAGTGLTHAEKCLAILDAKIEGRLTEDMEEFVILGRQVKRIDGKLLLEMREKYRQDVWRERNPGKLGPTIKFSFEEE